MTRLSFCALRLSAASSGESTEENSWNELHFSIERTSSGVSVLPKCIPARASHQFRTLLAERELALLSKTTQTAKLKKRAVDWCHRKRKKRLFAQSELLPSERGFQVLVMNQILPTNFLNEAGLNSTSLRRPTVNSLKSDQPRR